MRSNNSKNKSSNNTFSKTVRRLMEYMKNDRITFLIVVAFSILSTVFMIIGPKISGNATTEIFNGIIRKISNPNDGIDFLKIFRIISMLFILYILSAVFSYLQSYLMSGVSQRISYNLRKEISEKFDRLPISYFDTHSRGDILSKVTNDVDVLSQTLNQSLMQVVTSFVTIIGIFIMMLSINVWMTIASLIIIPITMFIMSFIIKRSQIYFKEQQKHLGDINGRIEEAFGGISMIKAYNGERFEEMEFNRINSKLYNTGWKSQFLSSIMMPIMVFVGNLGYVIVAILGGYMAVCGKITVGDIQAFIQYVKNFTQPLNQFAQIMNLLQSTVAAADRIFEFLDEEEIDYSGCTENISENLQGNIKFDHVRFGYSPDKIIIKDFNVDVRKGQKVAIVGPTGAGKTTLVKLLMRFYSPNSGGILIDGVDISEIKIDDYRRNFAMVLQETWLFNGSIMDNLRYGKLDASDEDVYKAAKMAYADRFILTQENGYDTILDEDTKNISQGQKQLLTIARAILSDPKILILDEATSSVDTRTELLIQKAMDNLIKDRTSFIIAHRLSTIRNADLILVLKDGDIIEQGNHEELMKLNGFYKELYKSQYSDE